MDKRKHTVEYNTNLNIRISHELKDKLTRVAEKNDIKASELVREFIRRLEE